MLAYRKIFCVLGVLPLIIFCGGCLRLQQEITIEADNQGSFKMQISLPLQVYQRFVGNEQMTARQFFDPDKGSVYFSPNQGFRVDNYRVFAHEGRQYVQVEGRLTDVKKALESGKLGAFTWTKTAEQAKLRMTWQDSPPEGAPAMKQAMAGLKLFLKINVPGTITSTTAHKQAKRSASWTFNADQNADFIASPPTVEVTYEH